jgi:hypothetical protein
VWISQQTRQSRLSARQVAEQVIALENARHRSFFLPSRRQSA